VDSTPSTALPETGPAPSDEFGRIEARGIDYIPPDERHGEPRGLFLVWASANVNFLYVVLGGLLIVFGLSMWQALAVVVIGNLFWVAIGLLAVTGPVSGSPSGVINRSMFGVVGNRLYQALLNWPIFIAYEAVNLALGALAGFALADQLGFSADRPIQIAIVAITAAITVTVSVYGHATIARMSGVFTGALTVVMVILGVCVLTKTDWDYVPPIDVAPTGWAVLATMTAGVTVIASAPLSWGISADYARYLPADTSRLRVAGWTALGGFVPAVLLGSVGVLAGTVIDMTEAQTALAQILPSWAYSAFLLFVVLGCMTNNILTMYSSGLCLQAIGIPLRRAVTVLIDGLLGVALALYALFVANFTDALSTTLELTVALLGPTIAIYATDIVLRRNRYDAMELNDLTPDGPFWFTRGWNIAGFSAIGLGTLAAALCVNTTPYQGPISAALDGADLSTFVGPLVAVAVYVAVTRWLYPGHVVRGDVTA
jgi:nucleobase:cation symporter-1, NCS1 family